jgi:hypothetical protein
MKQEIKAGGATIMANIQMKQEIKAGGMWSSATIMARLCILSPYLL